MKKHLTEENFKRWFKISCIWEGISCFILFLIAMPLKYQYDYTLIMPFAGSFHGFWFSAYILLAFLVKKYYKWEDEDFAFYLMFAFIPFATFLVHKEVKKFEAKEKEGSLDEET